MDVAPRKVKNLVIGGGLSGLTFGFFQDNADFLVIEAEDRPGGYCKTIQNANYVWDYAGHFYHFRAKQFKFRELFESLVPEDEIVHKKKNTKIFYNGSFVDYPFQTNIHELEKTEFIECLYDLYFREEQAEYANFLAMLYGKFGRAITEKFLRPYNEKLYAVGLDRLDVDAMGRFFPYADLSEIIRNMRHKEKASYNDTFLYLKKGTGYFIDRLYDQLPKDSVLLGKKVVHVDSVKKIATLSSGEKITYENLINTAPLNQFLSILGGHDALLEKMSYNKVLVYNLGFDSPSKKYRSEHWVYFPDKNINFYRVGFYNNILNTDKLSIYVEIGLGRDTDFDSADAEEILGLTLQNLQKAGVITKDQALVDKSIVLMDPAYVHIEKDTDVEIRQLLANLEKDHIYALGRYGRWVYSSMEDCMIWASELSKRLS